MQIQKLIAKKLSPMKNIKHLYIVVLLGTIAPLHANYYTDKFANMVGMVAAYKPLNMVTTLCHEFGHALAAKFLFNNPIHIGLGTLSKASLYSGKYVSLKKDIFSELIDVNGYAVLQRRLPAHGFKPTIVNAAGPCVGASAAIACAYAGDKLLKDDNYAALAGLNIIAGLNAVDHLSNLKIYKTCTNNSSDGAKIAAHYNFSDNAKKLWTRSVRGAMLGAYAWTGHRLFNIYQNYKA
jgi:hypothetical protein